MKNNNNIDNNNNNNNNNNLLSKASICNALWTYLHYAYSAV